MQPSSSSRSASLRSRPPFDQSFSTLPTQLEVYPYAASRQHLKDKTIIIPVPDLKAPTKQLQLKTTKQKPFGSGSFSTVSGSSKPYVPTSSPNSNSKAATISSRPASRASKRHPVPAEISKNATPTSTPALLCQKQVSQRHELGPENWTPITAKVIASTPPPRLKIHRHRRGTILPKVGTASLFGPVQSLPGQKCKDVFYDRKCDSPPSLSHSNPQFRSPHTAPARLLVTRSSPKPLPAHQRTRSALSLPSRQLKSGARAVSKMVTWDPSIVSDSPKVPSISKNQREKDENEMENNGALDQIPTHKLDVQDCVETIKEWGKADKSKLVSLIEALKQLELGSEEEGKGGVSVESSNDHDEGVLITTVKSMNPRVPDFESSGIIEANNRMSAVEEPEGHRPANSGIAPSSESDYNKENIPEVPIRLQAISRGNGVSRIKKRISIIDDYNSTGREVDSFATWYAEMQLREFAKKYPLTGRKASAVRQTANISSKLAKATEEVTSVSGGSELVANGFKCDFTRGEDVSSLRELERTGGGGKEDSTAKKDRRDDTSRRQYVRPRRRDLSCMTDPLANKNAAIIQERLEVLLLSEKERKALEGMPDMARTSVRYVDCGTVFENGNPYYGGFHSEGSSPLRAALWIPSDRLKLQRDSV